MADTNSYAVLGLQKGAAEDEIKRAYIELVKKYDPERHTERFMVIQAAYNRLRDVEARAREDVATLNVVRADFMFSADEDKWNGEPPSEEETDALRHPYQENPSDAAAKEALAKHLLLAGRSHMLRKQWPEAIKYWKEVVEIDPTHIRARHNLCNGYISLGTSYALHMLDEEAIELWEEAVKLNPDQVAILHNLAIVYGRLGNSPKSGFYWAETVKRWTRKMNSGGTDSDYFRHCIIEVHRMHGEKMDSAPQAASTRSPSPATSSSTSRVDVPRQVSTVPAPSSTAVPRQRVPAPSGASASPVEPTAGETRQLTINRLRKILELNSKDADAHFQLVHVLMEEGQWNDAVRELDALAREHPKNTEVLNLRGWCLLNSGQVDPAFSTWQRAMLLDPKDSKVRESMVRARLMVGKQLRDKGLFTHALVHFKSLLRLLPQSAEVHLEIAATYDMKGDVRSATNEYQQVMALDPKNAIAKKALVDLKMKR
ncbi:MAG: tetratricopeptide repeat protein [Candidatus Sumerlaeia bacterium]|nr:tetratricopeptide repeat protein [Candidatus Sumerlaeia bacterium]